MTDSDYALWAEASLTDNGQLAATLPRPAPLAGAHWAEITPGQRWDSWLSCHDSGTVIDGSGVAYTGTLAGSSVARTYDGREFTLRAGTHG